MIHRAGDIVYFDAVAVRIKVIYCCGISFRLLFLLSCHSINECRIGDLGKSLSLIAVQDGVDLFVSKDHSGKNAACRRFHDRRNELVPEMRGRSLHDDAEECIKTCKHKNKCKHSRAHYSCKILARYA